MGASLGDLVSGGGRNVGPVRDGYGVLVVVSLSLAQGLGTLAEGELWRAGSEASRGGEVGVSINCS